MKRAADQQGSALLTVLAMIVILSILVGSVLTVHVIQYRFIHRDVHRVQARYCAEAGVYTTIERLQKQPYWRPKNEIVTLAGAGSALVTVESFGGFLLIRSSVQRSKSRYTVRAWVGEIPPNAFRNAIFLWGTESSLNVAGHTQVIGDIIIGERGMTESIFKGQGFDGLVAGEVHATPGLEAPFFDHSLFDQAIDRCETYLLHYAYLSPLDGAGEELSSTPSLPSENARIVRTDDLRLSVRDSLLFDEPVTIITGGDLILEGPLHFLPGTIFISGGTLHLQDNVVGEGGLFYGRRRIEVTGSRHCAGQFLSAEHIRISRNAYLRYPSVLYISGSAAVFGGSIEITHHTAVDGTVIHPTLSPQPDMPRARIQIADSAKVRGAVYNGLETEMSGSIYGSLLTHQLYFYDTPTSYINWLKDATINVSRRPINYVCPLQFSPTPRLTVFAWDEHGEEVDESKHTQIAQMP